ncbi:MAG: hypothetical protein MI867_24225 [Pseudomonadales bacterium]|nr:hypothetical protein [Pseudomonadales bacterium]
MFKKITYPSQVPFYIEVPVGWVDESKDRLSVLSSDERLEVACTIYQGTDVSLEEFAKTRYEAVKRNMRWYLAYGKREFFSLNDKEIYKQSFKGVWPEESQETLYVVYVFQFMGLYVGLTFTAFNVIYEDYQADVQHILETLPKG